MSSLTAADYKNAGNKLCSLFRYDEAITYYNKAISKNPEVSIFYSNRALCYLKLQQWQSAAQDCRQALELEPNLIKGHFFLGQTLAELGNYDDALKHLQRAHELAKEKKLNFGDDIAYQIRLTKRRRWNKIEDEATQLEDELEEYLIELIKKDTRQQVEELKQQRTKHASSSRSGEESGSKLQRPDPTASTSTTNAATTTTTNNNNTTADTSTSSMPPAPPTDHDFNSGAAASTCDEAAAHSEAQEIKIQSKCDSYINKLESMFNNLKMRRKKRDVPDYLCGKISFEIMHDPVITPSGITYDRQDIEEHLKRVGHFDPITRQPLLANQLITNLAMKEVVDAYLNENEWAHYY